MSLQIDSTHVEIGKVIWYTSEVRCVYSRRSGWLRPSLARMEKSLSNPGLCGVDQGRWVRHRAANDNAYSQNLRTASCDEHTRSTRSWIILSHRPAIHTVVMEKALIALYYPRTRCPQIHAFRTANETLSCIAGL